MFGVQYAFQFGVIALIICVCALEFSIVLTDFQSNN